MIKNDKTMDTYIYENIKMTPLDIDGMTYWTPDSMVSYICALNNICASTIGENPAIPSKFYSATFTNPIAKSMIYTSYTKVAGDSFVPKNTHWLDVINAVRVIVPDIDKLLIARGIGFKWAASLPPRSILLTEYIELDEGEPLCVAARWVELGFLHKIQDIISLWDKTLGINMSYFWNRYIIGDSKMKTSPHLKTLDDVFY